MKSRSLKEKAYLFDLSWNTTAAFGIQEVESKTTVAITEIYKSIVFVMSGNWEYETGLLFSDILTGTQVKPCHCLKIERSFCK